MILLPRYTDLYNQTPIAGSCKVGGEFRLVLMNEMGQVIQDTGWMRNLITNYGLIALGSETWQEYLHIGSSATAPAFTDTALVNWLASASALANPVQALAPAATNWEFATTRVARFTAGVGTGTIRELGMGSVASNVQMAARALVSPAVVKAANHVLDVFYKFTHYPNIVDRTGSTTIDAVSYDYIVRGMELDDNSNGGLDAFTQIRLDPNRFTHDSFTGEIGAITASPSTSIGSGNPSTNAVETDSGSGYTDYNLFWDLDDGNDALGIRSISLRDQFGVGSNLHGWQIRFGATTGDARIPKDATKVFDLDFKVTWTRH